MTDSSKTLIAALLDRSGSMQSSVRATQDGYDELINGQKAEPGVAAVTLAQFDSQYEIVYHNRPLPEVPPLQLIPRGSTALLDGIGRLINETGAELAALDENDRPGTVIVIIMTDGGENASREFNWAKIKEMITTQQEKYGWKFIFIGANINAEEVGGRFGLGRDQVLQFNSHDYVANKVAYRGVSNYTSSLRSGNSVAVAAAAAFTDDLRSEAMGDELPPEGRNEGESIADYKARVQGKRTFPGSSR